MPIGWAEVQSTNKGSAGSSYTSTSWTPGANQPPANYWVVFVHTVIASGTPNTPTLTGNGGTWIQKDTRQTGLFRITSFVSGNAITAGGITADFAAQSQADIRITIYELSGVDNTNPVVQATGTVQSSGVTSITTSLSTFAIGIDLGLEVVQVNSSSSVSMVAATGWSFGSNEAGLSGTRCATQATNATATGPQKQSASASWTGSFTALQSALEIRAIPDVAFTEDILRVQVA